MYDNTRAFIYFRHEFSRFHLFPSSWALRSLRILEHLHSIRVIELLRNLELWFFKKVLELLRVFDFFRDFERLLSENSRFFNFFLNSNLCIRLKKSWSLTSLKILEIFTFSEFLSFEVPGNTRLELLTFSKFWSFHEPDKNRALDFLRSWAFTI